MKMNKKKRIQKVQIVARVTLADYKRLKDICEKYGFKSVYQLQNYLCYSFLRAVDKEHDPIDEPVPDEIVQMFDDMGTPKLPIRYRKARPVKKSTDL